jgi:hypothetical protein
VLEPWMIAFAPFLMVIGIVWVRGKQQIEEKRIAAGSARGESDSTGRQTIGRVEELEERVRILESIVTDGGYHLAQKIEALRDERPLEARLETAELREKI